jgi:hypothetical protein
MNITDEMYETMIHMIGYGKLNINFIDAVDSCDHESLLNLAQECNDRWGSSCVDIQVLRKRIEEYNEEE